jgi:hypothetical protein
MENDDTGAEFLHEELTGDSRMNYKPLPIVYSFAKNT